MNKDINYVDFRDFLLDYEKCTTEEMELALHLLDQYVRFRKEQIFIDNEKSISTDVSNPPINN